LEHLPGFFITAKIYIEQSLGGKVTTEELNILWRGLKRGRLDRSQNAAWRDATSRGYDDERNGK
jgi:hypothetical protein